jgi:hypothetical protein
MKKILLILCIIVLTSSIVNAIDIFDNNNEKINDIIKKLPLQSSLDITWTKHIIEIDINHASGIYSCDINNDNNVDVFACAAHDNELAYWINNGASPPDWTKNSIDDNFEYPMDIFIIDIDNDNDFDVLGAAWVEGEISLWINNGGNPIQWKKQKIRTNYPGAHEVFSCDIDSDGDNDILGASAEANRVDVWINEGGSPIVWTEQQIGSQFGGSRSVYAIDIDYDHDLDVLGAAFNDNEIMIWYNEGGNPIEWIEHTIANDFTGSHHVFSSDVDSDGDMDVLGAAYTAKEISWWKNEGGTPINWRKQTIDSTCDGAMMVIVEDINNDGHNDVIASSSLGNSIFWWSNDGNNPITWTKYTIDNMNDRAWPLHIVDMDKDGDMDVLGGSELFSGIMWYENSLYPVESDLESEGSLSWVNVKPASTVTGAINIFNNGIDGSTLTWEIIETPEWGTWSFNPNQGSDLTPEMGDITIEVTVIIPDEKNQEYTGDLTIVNKENPDDYEIIDIICTTVKNQQSLISKSYLLYHLFLLTILY